MLRHVADRASRHSCVRFAASSLRILATNAAILKVNARLFYLQALCDVSVVIATKFYAKIDFAIFCGVQLGVQTLGRTHVRYA